MKQISVTEISAWKSCRLYHSFSYTRALAPAKPSVGALWFGTGIHVALATYYKYGTPPVDNWNRWFEREKQIALVDIYDSERDRIEGFNDLGREMMASYLPYAQANDGWEVVDVEKPITFEIFPGVEFKGSLDLLVRKNGKLWIVDHKTCSSFIDPEQLVFDPQMAYYLWLVWKVYNEVPGGAIYSMLRKAIPAEPMLVYGGTALSKAKGIDTTPAKYLAAIERNGFNASDYTEVLARISRNEFFRRETVIRSARELKIFDQQILDEIREMTRVDLPIYPTPTRDCVWSCSYSDLCRARLTGGDVEFTIQANYREVSTDERFNQRWLEPEV